jgi:hypothetical protein
MASLPKLFHLRHKAVSPFHSLGTCESREFAANSSFTVRARFCQLSRTKELPLRTLKFHTLSYFPPRFQQPTNSNTRARFHSRLAIFCQAHPRYPSSLRPFLPTKASQSFSTTFTTKTQSKSSSYQPPNISPTSKISSEADTSPSTEKHILVTEAMYSSPDVSDVSTVPTPASTPEDFKTILAQYGMTPSTLTEVRDELVSVARVAGDMMLNADSSIYAKSDTKNNTSDRVTETGKHSPPMLHYPNSTSL